MIYVQIRFHHRDGQTTRPFDLMAVPRRGDNIFHEGERFEVAQVQHYLGPTRGSGTILVIATIV